MTAPNQDLIHDFVCQCLAARNDEDDLDDHESLFLSGRLDSLAVTQLVVFLEAQFSVDFSVQQFDVGSLDSVEQIAEFAARHGVVAAE